MKIPIVSRWMGLGLAGVGWLLGGPVALASFHVMRIEQVIGGVNGNPAAQAIQLQTRTSGQNLVSFTSLWVCDAAGSNRVLLLNVSANVLNSAGGARILLSTAAFNSAMVAVDPAYVPDFTLANAIPASYLAAGRLTFEQDGGTVASPGTIYWSVSWGGAGYTGSNTGSTQNDADGNFGPPYGSALPTAAAQGIHLTSASTALSTTNLADYSLTTNPATVTRNNGTSYVLPVVLTALESWRQTNFGTTQNTGNAANGFDFEKDGLVNLMEFALGLDPKVNSAHLVPPTQLAGGNLSLGFTQPAGVAGITYRAERGSSIVDGVWTAVPDTGSGNQHLFSVPAEIPGKDFLRLKVTEP